MALLGWITWIALVQLLDSSPGKQKRGKGRRSG
jgi:hypothetical protein